MHASSLLQSVIKPRNFPNSSQRTISTSADLCVGSSRKDSTPVHRTSVSAATKDGAALQKIRPAASEKEIKGPASAVPTGTKSLPTSPRTCLCSPTNHAGSFRCRLHRGSQKQWPRSASPGRSSAEASHDETFSFSSAIGTTPLLRVSAIREKAATRTPICPSAPFSTQKKPNSPVQTSRLSRVFSAENLDEAGQAEA